MTIRVDPGTFGGSEAARVLAEILPDKRAVGKVKALLQHYERVLKTLNEVKDVKHRKYLLDLVRLDTVRRVRMFHYEDPIRSFIQNVVMTRAKERVLRPLGQASQTETVRERRTRKRHPEV